MDFVSIEYDLDLKRWVLDDESDPNHWQNFQVAAENSKLMWEYLDKLQRYNFKVLFEGSEPQGLRFLGVEARWGEFVSATPDQMVLRNPL